MLLEKAKRLDDEFQNRRAGAVLLSERQAWELARGFHDHLIDCNRDNPSKQVEWQLGLYEHLWESVEDGPLETVCQRVLFHSIHPARQVERRCIATAEGVLRKHGLKSDEGSVLLMAKAVALALQRASEALQGMGRGIFAEPRTDERQPKAASPQKTFEEVFEAWACERKPAPKTLYEWKRSLLSLQKFVGCKDARVLTVKNVRDWKNSLVKNNLSSKTGLSCRRQKYSSMGCRK